MKEVMAHDRMREVESKHHELAEQVRLLERRAYLTPDEQRVVSELKKQKLAAKDELYALRRQ